MDYTIARELKDAGFPKIRIGENFNHTVGNHSDDRGGASDYPCDCMKDYFPTLEELIEACGNDFGGISRSKDGAWIAYDITAANLEDAIGGKTPTEVVAKLWLALNPKVSSALSRDDITTQKHKSIKN